MNIQHFDDSALLFMHTEDIHLLAPLLFFSTVHLLQHASQNMNKEQDIWVSCSFSSLQMKEEDDTK